MQFGDTYIFLFGFKIFEPSVILTNLLIFLVCAYYFRSLNKFNYTYSKQMALFVLLMGVSSCFASIGHGAQHQLGVVFFRIILFISHALTLISIYFCFRGPYTFYLFNNAPNKTVLLSVIAVLFVILFFATITGNFLLIKIPAGVVLIYSLAVHYYSGYKHQVIGSGLIVAGILISFLSIIVHSVKLSFSDWFNYKDIAHVIIALSLIIICEGVKIIVTRANGKLYNGVSGA